MATGQFEQSFAIVKRDPAELKNHPLNIKLYRERLDDAFLESVERFGIQSPLTVCKSKLPELNDVVVKGRRRRMAAIKKQIPTVDCIEWECDDPLEIEERLILDNVRNETTVEERARMYEELKRIESERAERRMKAGKASDPTGILPQGSDDKKQAKKRAPTASETSAKSVGMSAKTAENAVKVIHAADQIRKTGDEKKADDLIDTLNNGSVAKAVRKVEEVKKPAERDPGDETNPESDKINTLTAALARNSLKLLKDAEALFRAIDDKKHASKAFAERHPRYECLMRQLIEFIRSAKGACAEFEKAWIKTRREIEE